MQQILKSCSAALILTVMSVLHVHAQEDTTKPTSADPKLIEWKNSRIPKEYTVASIAITGIRHLDTSIVYSIANINPGDKFMHPGSDIFGKAIANLWRQKLFSNVQIYVTRVEDDRVWVEVNVQERPRLGNFRFIGPKKTEQEELQIKLNLVKQTIITENTRREIIEKTTKFYTEKAYRNVAVRIEEKEDTAFVNSNEMIIYVEKGGKVKIDNIRFFGNESVDDFRLKKQLKGTKEMGKASLHPISQQSPFGEEKPFSFNQWLKEWGFLSLSKTKKVLDPWFRFKLSGAKFDEKKYEEDREKLLDYYNSLGYRDAQIVKDTLLTITQTGNINLDIKVDEGRRYYFGNITWKGNAKYTDSTLNNILGQ